MALLRGPVVYCLEGVDNGARLSEFSVDPADITRAVIGDTALCGLPTLSLPAYRDEKTKPLYFPIEEAKVHPITARFIPYFAFANRGKSDMRVFVRRFSK